MNNADLIVKTMKEAGVTHCFGIPSGNVLPMLEAMRKGGISPSSSPRMKAPRASPPT